MSVPMLSPGISSLVSISAMICISFPLVTLCPSQFLNFLNIVSENGSGAIPDNGCSFGKMIFWVLCRQDLRPERWNGHFFFGQRFEVELVFLDLLCYSMPRIVTAAQRQL